MKRFKLMTSLILALAILTTTISPVFAHTSGAADGCGPTPYPSIYTNGTECYHRESGYDYHHTSAPGNDLMYGGMTRGFYYRGYLYSVSGSYTDRLVYRYVVRNRLYENGALIGDTGVRVQYATTTRFISPWIIKRAYYGRSYLTKGAHNFVLVAGASEIRLSDTTVNQFIPVPDDPRYY